jgi:hypothetical protein
VQASEINRTKAIGSNDRNDLFIGVSFGCKRFSIINYNAA